MAADLQGTLEMMPYMDALRNGGDDASLNTVDEQIDQAIRRSLRLAANNPSRINERLTEIDDEWPIEKALQLNGASLALTGIVLAAATNRRWLILSAVAGAFMIQQSLQGWCPAFPLMRCFGLRTRAEIERERYALKLLRGDFGQKITDADLAWEAVKRS